ncbi:hypothetical protein CGCF415_v001439 [Colletotrichum fructicola]|uniref:Uncharacterized protein n=1 Tax=Colletotrichum fructicola (strain Nara gc5) TaxID=1213859 RepID=L2GFH9_COLFN|nr:uncharacterized protein CGMCC3_g5307 [Colletotrichum fructicola]KAF4491902.1 hypothetical protein CGGC5_v000458 [Colletotrichum fructicola Nara gc5]KAE9578783.1 hypothetical protein CGMCC3_g5307 [Colletotrichum fructicola]KAF4432938.1 hypothetical protein CFRS1_v007793 [Colletotrichum fructicola]KAF4904772.1 hypothetical protein CGCFRS4_v000895 [Colletotrichum fructicola]KAF4915401.1 hypothetical protein CGCF415_v001439 [Colletotrichum fructicola]
MPNSFDRLERLFSKRKDLTIQTTPAPFEYTGPKTASLDHSFPQPSFIRPRVSRMKARDERIVASQNERRAQSLPENQSERVSIHISHLSSSSATTLNLPARSMSLNQRRETQTVASLRGFDFPAPPTGRLPASPACATSSPRTLPAMHKVSPEHRHSSVILPPRADTPPSSDHEDDSSIKSSQVGRPSSAMSSDLPTPAASPEMKPVHEKRSSRDPAELSLAKRKAVAAATRRRREDKAASLRRPRESRSHRSATSSSQILKGGDVRDFFALSDDDILEEPELEEVPDTPIIPAPLRSPPSPPTPASTSSAPRSRRTSSIYADDVAKEGALQVAQIAAKHNFDLVYIVNLWPEYASDFPSSPYRASLDLSSSRPSSVRNSLLGPMEGLAVESAPGMTGRLLAAYGLSNLNSPFRISANVQAKILKHEGWMEYRSDDAKDGEFARGYGHAFHTAVGRRGSANSSPRSSSSQDILHNDRGIVFAAYRYPGKDSTAAGCSKEELESLRADAEGLVDYLVAIHKARRLRDPMTLQTLTDEEETFSS